jgi:cytochrome P460
MLSARNAVLAGVLAAAFAGRAAAEPKAAALPKDYRSWTHVRSMVVTDPEHGMYGFQDVYANKLALETFRARTPGKPFRDGAVIVASIHDVDSKEGMVKAGAKLRTAVRVKDHTATATGGWRFSVYDRKGEPVSIDPAQCMGCHVQAKDTDFVFARFTE